MYSVDSEAFIEMDYIPSPLLEALPENEQRELFEQEAKDTEIAEYNEEFEGTDIDEPEDECQQEEEFEDEFEDEFEEEPQVL